MSRIADPGAGAADEVAAAFDAEVRPRLPALAARREALAAGFRREALGIGGVGAVGLAVAVALGLALPGIVVALVAAAWLGLHYVRRRRAWTEEALDAVVPPALRALGAARHGVEGSVELLREFEILGLVGAARHRILVHRIEGRRGETRYDAQHATLARTRARRGGATRLFHGLLLKVAVEVPPPVRLTIVPANESMTQVLAGVVRALLPPSHERVEIGDPEFERRYHVLAPAAGAAEAERVRAFLSRGFREAFLAIDAGAAEASGRPGLRAAFDGDWFYLAVPRVERPGWGPFRRERLRPYADPGGLSGGDTEAALRQVAEDLALADRIVARLVRS